MNPKPAQLAPPIPIGPQPWTPEWHYEQANHILAVLDQRDSITLGALTPADKLARAHIHALLAQFPAPEFAVAEQEHEISGGSIEAQIIDEQREAINEIKALTQDADRNRPFALGSGILAILKEHGL